MKKPKHNIGDAPIEPAQYERMNQTARLLDQIFNGDLKGEQRRVGFCLLTFNFGSGPGRCNYISNANREDIVVMLKEQLARLGGQPDMEGKA